MAADGGTAVACRAGADGLYLTQIVHMTKLMMVFGEWFRQRLISNVLLASVSSSMR